MCPNFSSRIHKKLFVPYPCGDLSSISLVCCVVVFTLAEASLPRIWGEEAPYWLKR